MKALIFALSVAVFAIPNIAEAGLLKGVGKVVIVAGAAKAIKKIYVSAKKHPQSAKHIDDAQRAGAPKVLTLDRAGASERRRKALSGVKSQSGKDRDEYPPAMTKEGGEAASVRHIDPRDNRGSGACVGAQCRGVGDGEKVEIVVVE